MNALITKQIKQLGLQGFGGACGNAAIQMNKKIFNNQGTYVAGLNNFWLEEEGRWVGHIAVKYEDKYYDANGEISEEDIEEAKEFIRTKEHSIKEMASFHMSRKSIDSINSIENKYELDDKPKGFWYSCEHEWLNWVRIEMPDREEEHYYDVQLDYSKILIIDTFDKFKEFDTKYGVTQSSSYGDRYINWKKVSQDYSGIEICPYQYRAKNSMYLEYTWYITWDIASGCIWNKDAIKAIKPADKPNRKEQQQEEY